MEPLPPPPSARRPARWWREHAAFLGAALVCLLAFGWMLTFGTGRLFEADSFGNFYDYQAQAWLHGRWDVPEPALGGEAFVVNGKVYGYFGPSPALMRLPFIALGVGFGRWTRVCMLVDFAASLVAGYAILRQVGRISGRSAAPPAWQIITLTLAAGLGSTLFYLASRAYVYHEAILCGAAFSLWSVWFGLRYLALPGSRSWIGAAICGTLAVQARPPAGLYALTFLGCVALFHALVRRRFSPLWIGGLAALGVLSFDAVGFLKFGVFDGCPLRFHVQYTPARLAAIGGRNFHVGNLRFNADSYFWRSNVSIDRHFPWLHVDYLNRTREYPESKIDYRDPTLALPYAMPTLVLFSLASFAALAFPRPRGLRWAVGLSWIAAVPLVAAMLTAVAVTQRYTADFCPLLILTAGCGAATIAEWRAAKLASFSAVTTVLVGIAVQLALTLHQQRVVVWGVPTDAQQEYRQWQQKIDSFFDAPRP